MFVIETNMKTELIVNVCYLLKECKIHECSSYIYFVMTIAELNGQGIASFYCSGFPDDVYAAFIRMSCT